MELTTAALIGWTSLSMASVAALAKTVWQMTDVMRHRRNGGEPAQIGFRFDQFSQSLREHHEREERLLETIMDQYQTHSLILQRLEVKLDAMQREHRVS